MGHWHVLLAHLNTAIITLISAFLAITSQNVCQEPISVSQLGLFSVQFPAETLRCDPGLFCYSAFH